MLAYGHHQQDEIRAQTVTAAGEEVARMIEGAKPTTNQRSK